MKNKKDVEKIIFFSLLSYHFFTETMNSLFGFKQAIPEFSLVYNSLIPLIDTFN